jgi:hypothetical protein
MSIIKNTRNIYNNISTPEPAKSPVIPVNQELLDKVVSDLNKKPQIAPKIN